LLRNAPRVQAADYSAQPVALHGEETLDVDRSMRMGCGGAYSEPSDAVIGVLSESDRRVKNHSCTVAATLFF